MPTAHTQCEVWLFQSCGSAAMHVTIFDEVEHVITCKSVLEKENSNLWKMNSFNCLHSNDGNYTILFFQ
jgi:hypothetical protein